MRLLDEIRLNFASTLKGIREIENLSEKYKAWTVRLDEGYGVAVPYEEKPYISESFANAKIFSRNFITYDNKEIALLLLVCPLDSLRYEFASVCAQFVDPGLNGIDRVNLVNNPLDWWQKWRTLLGNSIFDKKAYSVIAELLALEKLIGDGKKIEWTGVNSASHDIETDNLNYEVKSTIKRYETTITISSQFQLAKNKPLKIYFCRLEESKSGESINEIAERLISAGYNRELLESQLDSIGFEKGSSKRNQKYKVLEKRSYDVDKEFPVITEASFVGGKIPDNIINIKYTIDLEGLGYTKW